MKLHPTKLALSAAVAVTLFMAIKKCFYRAFFWKMGMMGRMMYGGKHFIPGEGMGKYATMPRMWMWGRSFIGLLFIFVIAFLAALLFAALYNKLLERQ